MDAAAARAEGARVAQLLLHPSVAHLLSKRKLGEFLGGGGALNCATCRAYCRLHARHYAKSLRGAGTDMQQQQPGSRGGSESARGAAALDGALRQLLARFRLPGEAQQIDRVVESFAAGFAESQPRAFLGGADSAHVLAFSLIMLNTDLHNPSIREDRKMTEEQYLSTCRGIDNGRDFPAAALRALYRSIAAEEMRLDACGEGMSDRWMHEHG